MTQLRESDLKRQLPRQRLQLYQGSAALKVRLRCVDLSSSKLGPPYLSPIASATDPADINSRGFVGFTGTTV